MEMPHTSIKVPTCRMQEGVHFGIKIVTRVWPNSPQGRLPEGHRRLELKGPLALAVMLPVNWRFLPHCRKNSETRQGGQESKVRMYLSKNTLSEGELADR